MAYATPSEFTDYTEDTVENLLQRASDFIDSRLVGAVYEVDDDGVAVSEEILTAIKRATMAQAEFWMEGYGSPFGPALYDNVRIATVSLSSSNSGSGKKKDVIAPLAADALRSVGLWPIHPQVGG